jgi:hypothetical protein
MPAGTRKAIEAQSLIQSLIGNMLPSFFQDPSFSPSLTISSSTSFSSLPLSLRPDSEINLEIYQSEESNQKIPEGKLSMLRHESSSSRLCSKEGRGLNLSKLICYFISLWAFMSIVPRRFIRRSHSHRSLSICLSGHAPGQSCLASSPAFQYNPHKGEQKHLKFWNNRMMG